MSLVVKNDIVNACWNGDVKGFEKIIDNIDNINELIFANGITPLMSAVIHRKDLDSQLSIIKMLLDRDDIDVDAQSISEGNGMTALLYATECCRIEVIELLLERGGADPNIQDYNKGRTALIRAVSHNESEQVKLLLRYGADPRIRDVDGYSCMDYPTKITITMPPLSLRTLYYRGEEEKQEIREMMLFIKVHYPRWSTSFILLFFQEYLALTQEQK